MPMQPYHNLLYREGGREVFGLCRAESRVGRMSPRRRRARKLSRPGRRSGRSSSGKKSWHSVMTKEADRAVVEQFAKVAGDKGTLSQIALAGCCIRTSSPRRSSVRQAHITLKTPWLHCL